MIQCFRALMEQWPPREATQKKLASAVEETQELQNSKSEVRWRHTATVFI